jgi:hypothetical protein
MPDLDRAGRRPRLVSGTVVPLPPLSAAPKEPVVTHVTLSRPFALAALAGVLCLPASMVRAGEIYCLGSVNALRTQANGAVIVETPWNTQPLQVCNVATVWKGVPLDTCERWHAQLLLALSTRDSMLVYYPSTTASDCALMGAGSGADAPGFLANQ